jgi:hypothetical protein
MCRKIAEHEYIKFPCKCKGLSAYLCWFFVLTLVLTGGKLSLLDGKKLPPGGGGNTGLIMPILLLQLRYGFGLQLEAFSPFQDTEKHRLVLEAVELKLKINSGSFTLLQPQALGAVRNDIQNLYLQIFPRIQLIRPNHCGMLA